MQLKTSCLMIWLCLSVPSWAQARQMTSGLEYCGQLKILRHSSVNNVPGKNYFGIFSSQQAPQYLMVNEDPAILAVAQVISPELFRGEQHNQSFTWYDSDDGTLLVVVCVVGESLVSIEERGVRRFYLTNVGRTRVWINGSPAADSSQTRAGYEHGIP